MGPRRPGLAKVRGIPLLGVRRIVLVGLAPPRGAALIAEADVVSEGAEVVEAGGRRVYYGTTSFIIILGPPPPRGQSAKQAAEDEEVVAALVGDPHLRVHALRRARTEAAARASGSVGTLRAELSVQRTPTSIEIVIDVTVAILRAARAGV